MANHRKKIVLFGAGKIGRSFIGPLFHQGGYELVFIDKDKTLIDELNRRKSYNLIIRSDRVNQVHKISSLRGIFADDTDRVIDETATSGIVSVSVGANATDHVIPLLARSLLRRQDIGCSDPLDIIIAENLRNGAEHFRKGLAENLPGNYPLDRLAGLVETSIGKMVPIMRREDLLADPLQIFAEPYNTLIVSKDGFKNPIPAIEGLAPKENISAWVDRKLFIHNLGHVSIAYTGYLFDNSFTCLWEALNVPEIYRYARNTMLEASAILMDRYPDVFSKYELEEHIDELLSRFRNRALGDTIYRVGCDLHRKLGANDRLAGAIRIAAEAGLPYSRILFALVCGSCFRAKDENGNILEDDARFIERFNNDISSILELISGFDKIKFKKVFTVAEKIDREIKNGRFRLILNS